MRIGVYLANLDETPPVDSPVYTPSERRYCLQRRYPRPHLAGRYAAKKAASIALALDEEEEALLANIEVVRLPGGAPRLVFHGEMAERVNKASTTTAHLSISHSGNYAVALVVTE